MPVAPAPRARCLQVRGLKTAYLPEPGAGKPRLVTLIPGDGIGPEVTKAVVDVVQALEAPITWERYDRFP